MYISTDFGRYRYTHPNLHKRATLALYSKIIAILNLGKRDTVIIPEKLILFKSKFYMPANGN